MLRYQSVRSTLLGSLLGNLFSTLPVWLILLILMIMAIADMLKFVVTTLKTIGKRSDASLVYVI